MTLALDRRATHYGTRTALIDHTADRTLTYGELDERAKATAGWLHSTGVESGDTVAVIARNRLAWFDLFWATQRLDATLAPISHRLPPASVADLTARIDPALLLVEDQFDDLVGAVDAPVATIDEVATDDTGERAVEEVAPRGRAAPAMYLHTGGTTGVPKVVVVGADQLEWNAVTEIAAWGLGNRDVVPLLLPLFHTGGWNLLTLPTLYVGGTVVLQRSFDPGEALEIIERYGATKVFAVAAIFHAMADHDRFESTDFDSVDWCMSGGGPTPTALMERYRNRGIAFTQGYGLTEGGPNNLYFDASRPDPAGKAEENVGRPFPDCEARIVDDEGSVLEAGEAGELELRGPVTATGYLATSDGTFDGDWVSTGDLARVDSDGDYAILGRVDNMFVSGGENVYPEEIEAALETHPGVAGAGVIPVDHERWGQVPRAIIEPTPGAKPSESDLEDHAREHLPGFMVPRSFVLVESLPRSGPGKLDRQVLSEHR